MGWLRWNEEGLWYYMCPVDISVFCVARVIKVRKDLGKA